jgi:hypothetical protein
LRRRLWPDEGRDPAASAAIDPGKPCILIRCTHCPPRWHSFCNIATLSFQEATHDLSSTPQRALHAGIERPRHREGAQLAGRWRNPRPGGRGWRQTQGAARQQVADAVKAGGFGAREVFIRVNGIDTPWAR